MRKNALLDIIQARQNGRKVGIYSACTANEYAIEAVMEKAQETNTYALIEATANQCNQFGGYTGMQPKDFVKFVFGIADKIKFDKNRIVLGGDHLGPLTWQNEPEESAMEKSEELIRQYVLAGFTKIHIDTSMMVADDDRSVRLSDDTIARRAVRLARVSEDAYAELKKSDTEAMPPVYIVGSEVPIPGGAQENDESISITKPEQFQDTYNVFKTAFEKENLGEAFGRVIGVVVQPGVEFSDASVTEYDREKAEKLCQKLKDYPNIVFEGHSTDYQTPKALKQMVEDGIAILKVGPAITYALRQALFALSDIEKEVLNNSGKVLSDFRNVLEETMLSSPRNWKKYYHGNKNEIALKRKYSFSDRCRYYLPEKDVSDAINKLISNINSADIPISVIDQYMPIQYKHLREGKINMKAEELLKDRVKDYLDDYIYATV